MTLKIIVCAKQVPDPEGPPTSYEVDEAVKKIVFRGIAPVINPFDENALEAAIRLKEENGAHITLLSAGKNISKAVILKALAAGADESLLLDDEVFEATNLDSRQSAEILAAAIKKLDEFDLIVTGRQASDTNAGQVGLGLATLLGIPAVNLARDIKVSGEGIIVERLLPDGSERVKSPLPALVTVSGELGELRYPSMPAIKAAKKIPQTILKSDDLGLEKIEDLKRVETLTLKSPDRERRCSFVEADTPEDAGAKLAEKLRADKVL